MEKLKRKVYFFVILACFAAMLSSCSNASGGEGGGGDKPSKPGEITYTVEHWQQNIADDDYTKVVKDTQTLSGKIGKKTKAAAKTYTGFTAKAFEQKTLSAAETSVIKIYYDRKITALTLNPNGGKFYSGSLDPITINRKYGATFSIGMGEELWPSRDNYEFRGWAYDTNATTCDFPQNLNFEITDSTPSTVTLYAIWKQQNSVNGTISIIPPGSFIIQKNGNTYSAVTSEPGDYVNYGWYLNDISLSSWGSACSVNGRGDSCTIDAAELPVGYYELTFRATGMRTGIEYVSQYENPIFGTKTE